MPRTLLEDLSQAQRERLFHIDFRLRFLGTVSRLDLVQRFGIQAAAATRDLALYRELRAANLEYDARAKVYVAAEAFQPLFAHSASQVLTALSRGLGDDFVGIQHALLASDLPTQLNLPQLDILAAVSRAIYRRRVLNISYRSLSNGLGEREIIPFALVDNGLRWHVRAYDRKRGYFADFVINRIVEASHSPASAVAAPESKEADIQWNRVVELHLVPHPSLAHPETIAFEYGMTSGLLKAQVRAAVAGYVLRRWNVDCTADHSLQGAEFHLWLSNLPTLYGVENLAIAPGFRPESTMGITQQRAEVITSGEEAE